MTGRHIYTQSILDSQARAHEKEVVDYNQQRDKALLDGDIHMATEYHRQAVQAQQKANEYTALSGRLYKLTRKDSDQ